MASRSLSNLVPPASTRCIKWIEACKLRGIEVMVYCTFRSKEEQDQLYKIGRTVMGADPSPKRPMGRKVTDAKGGESFHQYCCAWDAVPVVGGKPMWDDKASYEVMGEEAKAFGIEWAGSWTTFKETAHFQYTGGLSLQDLKNGKVIK